MAEVSVKMANAGFEDVSSFFGASALGSMRTELLNQLLTLHSACFVLTVGDDTAGCSKSCFKLFGDGVFINETLDLLTPTSKKKKIMSLDYLTSKTRRVLTSGVYEEQTEYHNRDRKDQSEQQSPEWWPLV